MLPCSWAFHRSSVHSWNLMDHSQKEWVVYMFFFSLPQQLKIPALAQNKKLAETIPKFAILSILWVILRNPVSSFQLASGEIISLPNRNSISLNISDKRKLEISSALSCFISNGVTPQNQCLTSPAHLVLVFLTSFQNSDLRKEDAFKFMEDHTSSTLKNTNFSCL